MSVFFGYTAYIVGRVNDLFKKNIGIVLFVGIIPVICHPIEGVAQSIAIDLDRDSPGVQQVLEVGLGHSGPIRGAVVATGAPQDTGGLYALEIEIVSSSRTGTLFECSAFATNQGDVIDAPSSPGETECATEIEPNRLGRRSLLAEDTPFDTSGRLDLFTFDLPLDCQPGETFSLGFRTSLSDPRLGVRINGEGRSIGAGISSDIPVANSTVICLTGKEPSPTPSPTEDLSTPTPTPTATVTPTEVFPPIVPRLQIDFDRFEPGVQSEIEKVLGDEGLVQGAVVIVGPAASEAGSYAIEVVATNGETHLTVIDCAQSNFEAGEVVDAGESFVVETCTARTFRRTSLLAGSAAIGSDGMVNLFHFDLEVRCEPGDRLDFEFTTSRNNSLFGVDVDGRTYKIGEGIGQAILAVGGSIHCVEPTPTPTSTPTATPTDTVIPLPTLGEVGLIEIIEGIRAGDRSNLDLFRKSLEWME
ncbi:MAG: hypothetical protein KC994_03380 [Candidatus Omnitrophica bacterium]|nr:hypothetical protein [Candidatus Omnitrophota bacterium]